MKELPEIEKNQLKYVFFRDSYYLVDKDGQVIMTKQEYESESYPEGF